MTQRVTNHDNNILNLELRLFTVLVFISLSLSLFLCISLCMCVWFCATYYSVYSSNVMRRIWRYICFISACSKSLSRQYVTLPLTRPAIITHMVTTLFLSPKLFLIPVTTSRLEGVWRSLWRLLKRASLITLLPFTVHYSGLRDWRSPGKTDYCHSARLTLMLLFWKPADPRSNVTILAVNGGVSFILQCCGVTYLKRFRVYLASADTLLLAEYRLTSSYCVVRLWY